MNELVLEAFHWLEAYRQEHLRDYYSMPNNAQLQDQLECFFKAKDEDDNYVSPEMQAYLRALFKSGEKRTPSEIEAIFSTLRQSKQIKQLLKYGDNMTTVIRKYLCSSLVIRKISKGSLIIQDQKKDNEFYAILQGDALLLEQKPRETIQEEIDVLGLMVNDNIATSTIKRDTIDKMKINRISMPRKAIDASPPQTQSQFWNMSLKNSSNMSLNEIKKNQHNQKVMRRLSKHIDLESIRSQSRKGTYTSVKSIGALNTDQLDTKTSADLFEKGIFKYNKGEYSPHKLFMRQKNRFFRILAETECCALFFHDTEQKLIRAAMDNIQLKKRQHLIELIQKQLFKSLVSFDEVNQILHLFTKRKLGIKQSLFRQDQRLQEIFVLKEGTISISVEYQDSTIKKENSQKLQRIRLKKKHADLSIVSTRTILGEDVLFMDTVQYTADVVSQQATVYAITKDELLRIINDFPQLHELLYESVSLKIQQFDHKIQSIERELLSHEKAMQDDMQRLRICEEEEDKKNDYSFTDSAQAPPPDQIQIFKNRMIKDVQKVNTKNAHFLDNREIIKFEDTLNEVLVKDLVLFQKQQDMKKLMLQKQQTFLGNIKHQYYDDIVQSLAQRVDQPSFVSSIQHTPSVSILTQSQYQYNDVFTDQQLKRNQSSVPTENLADFYKSRDFLPRLQGSTSTNMKFYSAPQGKKNYQSTKQLTHFEYLRNEQRAQQTRAQNNPKVAAQEFHTNFKKSILQRKLKVQLNRQHKQRSLSTNS